MSAILWDVCWEYPSGRLDGCDPDRNGEAGSPEDAARGVRAYCSGARGWHLASHQKAGEPDLICSDFAWSGHPLGRVRWWVLILVDDERNEKTRNQVLAALNSGGSEE